MVCYVVWDVAYVKKVRPQVFMISCGQWPLCSTFLRSNLTI